MAKKKILYISRMGNDFERFVAMADYLRDDFEQTFLHVYPLERLISKCIYDLAEFEDCPLKDLSDYSLAYEKYIELNYLARKFKLKFFYDLGQKFKRYVDKRIKKVSEKILKEEKPALVVLTYVSLIGCPEIIIEIHKKCIEQKIPILFLFHGIGRYAINYKKSNDDFYSMLSGTIATAPSQHEFEYFYKLDIRTNPQIKKKWVVGDPRLSLQFVEKVQKSFVEKKNKSRKVKIALFGTNIGYLDGAENESQFVWLNKIVKKLLKNENFEIYIKFHPNNPPSDINWFLSQKKIIILSEGTNSGEVLSIVDLIITPPTSIVYEAMVLNKPIYIIDEIRNNPFSFSEFNIPCLTLREMNEYTFEIFIPNYNIELLNEHIWGNSKNIDCREKLKLLLKKL
ncbi:MAG: hypothetical protein COB02_03885 [Candidatus Cloacimonadota bacterium]|nr:MAG: hypothetical protein COB02_03885 [Candidatus Cloacimonadota bacterium]